MKAENRISNTKKPRDHQPVKVKRGTVSGWAPQPDLLTREEIRKIVIDQIG
jgi:hypothetical protein